MKSLKDLTADPRLFVDRTGVDGGAGFIKFKTAKRPAVVIWSFGGGWEHVSISFASRCPSWDEMGIVKDMFFREGECVVQYHPPKSEYVNQHPYCLHLWRPAGGGMTRPPGWMVGI